VLGVRRWRELVADRIKMEGYCSTGQSPQWVVVPMEKEEGEDSEKMERGSRKRSSSAGSEKMDRVGGR